MHMTAVVKSLTSETKVAYDTQIIFGAQVGSFVKELDPDIQ